MCGIVGASYGKGVHEDLTPTELAAVMMPAMIHRGKDAWGYMFCGPRGAVHSKKKPGPIDNPRALKQIKIPYKVRWWVGHVRKATNGVPTYDGNNHPIKHGNIIGVHNGGVLNYTDILKETGREDQWAQVDSEAIFAAIHKWGHRAGLSKILGSMVAVYANLEKPYTLHIARSKGRPLWLAKTVSGSIIFASEIEVLEATGLEFEEQWPLGEHKLIRLRDGIVMARIQYRLGGRRTPKLVDEELTTSKVKPQPIVQKRVITPRGASSRPLDEPYIPVGMSLRDWVEMEYGRIERKIRRGEIPLPPLKGGKRGKSKATKRKKRKGA